MPPPRATSAHPHHGISESSKGMFHIAVDGNKVYNNNGNYLGGFKFLTVNTRSPIDSQLDGPIAGVSEVWRHRVGSRIHDKC
jgi:hypothetical protein